MPRLDPEQPVPAVSLNGGVATAHLALVDAGGDEWRIAYNARAAAEHLEARAIERDGAVLLLVELPGVAGGPGALEDVLNAATRLLGEPVDPVTGGRTGPDGVGLAEIEPAVAAWWDAYRVANPRRG